MTAEPEDPERSSHSLTGIRGVPPLAVRALKEQWIETAEQVIAMSATSEGRQGLKALLSFDDQQLDVLLSMLISEVGPEEVSRLLRAVPGGPCGVVLTEKEKQRFKLK